MLLEDNGNAPAEFLLGDYTTFKVIVRNADIIENGTVGPTESGTNNNDVGTNDGTNNGTSEDANRKDAIVEMMRHNKRISVRQISEALNIPRRTLFRIIDVLKSENRIKRVGNLKSGTWEVIG